MTAPIRTYTVAQLAQLLHCSTRHVYRLFAARELRRVKSRHRTLILESELLRYLERNQK